MAPLAPRLPGVLVVLAAVAALASAAVAQSDLRALSDEFGDAATLADWSRVHLVEQWNNEQLEVWDIDVTAPGRMTMLPYTVTWYADYRGPLAFKLVSGDFVVTTDVTATARDGSSVPSSSYSLAGIMARTPRPITPATWTPGGENYVFLSLGRGDANARQFEVKTTTNSVSSLNLTPTAHSSARLQVARIGASLIMLRSEPGQPWSVHRRFRRTDFPDTLQVGLVSYTDWGKVSTFPATVHNANVLDPPLPPGVTDPAPGVPFNPDLLATFDYLRFNAPVVPEALVGRDLTDPTITDAELLAFLGDHAADPAPVAVGDALAPMAITLAAAPLPFRDRTIIRFELPLAGEATVAVFDLAGRAVRTLSNESLAAGRHARSWDGRDGRGARVMPGVYVVRLAFGRHAETFRLVRIP